MHPKYDILAVALSQRQRDYRDALDRIVAEVGDNQEAYASARLLREAIELVGCLRRLLPACDVTQLHAAFGAPGDFGYETPVGDALSRLYHGKS